MKHRTLITGWVLITFLLYLTQLTAQNTALPAVDIHTLDGNRIQASALTNDGMPMVMVFFKTNDNKCRETLFDICEAHENELAGLGVKLIAICIDCIGKTEHVKPFVYGHALNVEVYVDKNGNFKRAMGIPDAPYTILYDQQMKVYCEYSGYCAAAGDLVCGKMKECINKMTPVN